MLADLVMSLDNVIAVAAAAKGSTVLLIVGLAISIPLVVFASRLLLTLMDRLPIIITLGAALLGWVAGEMAVTDPVAKGWVDAQAAACTTPHRPSFRIPALRRIGGRCDRRGSRRHVAGLTRRPVLPARWRPLLGRMRRAGCSAYCSRWMAPKERHEPCATLIALRQNLREPQTLDVHLLNVQRPVSGDVATFVAGETLDDYYREHSEKALAPARALLAAAGMAFHEHRRVGKPGPTIAEFARAKGCDLIVMGTRGLGTHTGALLGSVAHGTAEQGGVPVLLVK